MAVNFISGQEKEKSEKENEQDGHSHYVEHDSIVAHKLIFPSKIPGRIISGKKQLINKVSDSPIRLRKDFVKEE